MSKGNLNAYRKVAFWEGISWIILGSLSLYKMSTGDLKSLVSIFGYIHGFLFTLYLVLMFVVGGNYKWGGMMYVIGLVAAIIPFGTFVYEKKFLKPLSDK